MHTQSLEVCIWRGRQEDWPEAGTSHGVAKVALRSLLTTLGSIGGTVSVNPGREHSSPTDGSIAILLFFKHRGLRSNDASPHKDGEMAGGHTEGGRGGVEVTGNGGPVQGSHQLDGAALDEKNNVGGVGDVKSRAGAEIVPPLPPSLLSFTGFSNSAVAFDLIPGQAVGDDTSQSQAQQVRDEPTAQTREPVRRGKLRVHVERAMRLPPATSMSEVPAPGASTEALPSTYVTFRWEEGGKPPLRSPLVLEPATSGRTVHAPTEDWRVRLGRTRGGAADAFSLFLGDSLSSRIVVVVYAVDGGTRSAVHETLNAVGYAPRFFAAVSLKIREQQHARKRYMSISATRSTALEIPKFGDRS